MWRRKSSFLPLSKLKNTKTEEQKENLTKDLSEGEWKRLEKILMGQEFEVELISTRRAGIQRVYREGEEHLGGQESRFVAGENVVSSREVVDAEVKKLLPEAQKNFDEHLMSRWYERAKRARLQNVRRAGAEQSDASVERSARAKPTNPHTPFYPSYFARRS